MVCGFPHLKGRADFLRVARQGRAQAMPGLVLQACPQPGVKDTPAPRMRLGITVSRKVGNAVTRNRARRRLRAAARQVLATYPADGFDLVLIGRPATVTRPFADLTADLEIALRRVLARTRGDAPTSATR